MWALSRKPAKVPALASSCENTISASWGIPTMITYWGVYTCYHSSSHGWRGRLQQHTTIYRIMDGWGANIPIAPFSSWPTWVYIYIYTILAFRGAYTTAVHTYTNKKYQTYNTTYPFVYFERPPQAGLRHGVSRVTLGAIKQNRAMKEGMGVTFGKNRSWHIQRTARKGEKTGSISSHYHTSSHLISQHVDHPSQ